MAGWGQRAESAPAPRQRMKLLVARMLSSRLAVLALQYCLLGQLAKLGLLREWEVGGKGRFAPFPPRHALSIFCNNPTLIRNQLGMAFPPK